MKKQTFSMGHPLTFEDLWERSPEDMFIFEDQHDQEGIPYDHYLPVIQDLLENGIDAIVDIGCGSGTQGYLFHAAGIRYVGLERYAHNLAFGEARLFDGSLIIKQACWPCDIPDAKGITTCVSMYALGIRGEEQSVPFLLNEMRKRFRRTYIVAFELVQDTAQQIWNQAPHWVNPDKSDEFGLQVYECPSFFRAIRHYWKDIANLAKGA